MGETLKEEENLVDLGHIPDEMFEVQYQTEVVPPQQVRIKENTIYMMIFHFQEPSSQGPSVEKELKQKIDKLSRVLEEARKHETEQKTFRSYIKQCIKSYTHDSN